MKETFDVALSWKETQIRRLSIAAQSLRQAVATIEKRLGEVAALQRAVCNCAHFAGRKQSHMSTAAVMLESTFDMTASFHFVAAQGIAIAVCRELDRAIAGLLHLPEGTADLGTLCASLSSPIEQLVGHCSAVARSLADVLVNAEREVEALQSALTAFVV